MRIINKIKHDINLSELFKGSGIALGFKIAGIALGYFFFLVISRWFGASEVGVFSISWTLLMFASVIGKLGLDSSIVRFLASAVSNKTPNQIKPIFSTGLFIVVACSSVVTAILIILKNPLSELFFDSHERSNLIVLIALAVIPTSLMSYASESLRGLKKIAWYSFLQNGTVYLAMIIIVLVFSLFGLEKSFLLQSLVISLVFLAAFSLFIYKYHEIKLIKTERPIEKREQTGFKTILKTSFPMMISNVLFLLMTWTDVLILGIYYPENEVGVYNISVKVAALISVALVAVNTIAAPKLAEIYARQDFSGLRKLVKQISLLNTVLSFPIFIVILFFPTLLMGVFGAEFTQGIEPLIILSIGQVINSFSGSTLYILNMTGKEKTGRNIMLVTAIINLVLNFVLVPQFGMLGSAIATMSSTIIWNILAVIYIYRYYGFLTYPINIRNRHEG